MQNSNNRVSTERLKNLIIYGLQEKKAIDIVLMDLREVKNAVCDFFIICSGNSDTQTDALRNSVEAEVYKAVGEDPRRVEGQQNREWILMDYFDIVVHIFRKDRRKFYGLEELWGDADITPITEDVSIENERSAA